MSTRPRAWGVLLLAVLVSGFYFRVAEFAANRSLWLDEAALAQNVLRLPLADLARGRLEYDQSAPPGFLFATRALAAAAGSGEQALRLMPLLAGQGALALFGFLAWRRLGPAGAFAAAALAAWSWPLIYYSNEFKQYSTDIFVSVLLFALAMGAFAGELTRRRAAALAAAGMAAMFFSQPAVFILAALGTSGLLHAARARNRETLMRWLAVSAAWAAWFFAEFYFCYTSAFGNDNLFAYYQEKFFRPWPPAALAASVRDGVWPWWTIATSEPFACFWLALLALGGWVGWKSAPRETGFIAFTVLFTLLASALHAYPLMPRLLLFLLPLLFWVVGRGAGRLAGLGENRAAPWVALLLCVPLWPALRDAVVEARQPQAREHLRPVVARLAEAAQPGDVILVWNLTSRAFDYYWPRQPHADAAVHVVSVPEHEPVSPAAFAAQIVPMTRGHDRVWLVVTHYEYGALPENLRALVAALRGEFPRAADYTPVNGSARCFVFTMLGAEPPAGVAP